jgi:hypothetical protein
LVILTLFTTKDIVLFIIMGMSAFSSFYFGKKQGFGDGVMSTLNYLHNNDIIEMVEYDDGDLEIRRYNEDDDSEV